MTKQQMLERAAVAAHHKTLGARGETHRQRRARHRVVKGNARDKWAATPKPEFETVFVSQLAVR